PVNGEKRKAKGSRFRIKTRKGDVLLADSKGLILSTRRSGGRLIMDDIFQPCPDCPVAPDFHATGIDDGSSGPLNANLFPYGGGSPFPGTAPNQTYWWYDFQFPGVTTGTYYLVISNGDGVDPVVVS